MKAECAKIIANQNDPVMWLTPLGLPVVQPYKKSYKGVVATPLQSVTFKYSPESCPVNKSKQRTAFPPNYVHSLDSSHMLMTAMSCYNKDITFAAVSIICSFLSLFFFLVLPFSILFFFFPHSLCFFTLF